LGEHFRIQPFRAIGIALASSIGRTMENRVDKNAVESSWVSSIRNPTDYDVVVVVVVVVTKYLVNSWQNHRFVETKSAD
jgi:hypothetical protein